MSLGLVFVAKELGNILPAAMKVGGLLGSPVAGLFVLGMFFPMANEKASTNLYHISWQRIGGRDHRQLTID